MFKHVIIQIGDLQKVNGISHFVLIKQKWKGIILWRYKWCNHRNKNLPKTFQQLESTVIYLKTFEWFKFSVWRVVGGSWRGNRTISNGVFQPIHENIQKFKRNSWIYIFKRPAHNNRYEKLKYKCQLCSNIQKFKYSYYFKIIYETNKF